jgi:putative membrane protein
MILPGISGSFLLVIMGKYGQVMRAVHEFDLGVLIVFGIGFGGGILAFSRVLKFLLARYHALTMTLLVGLMAGSVRRVWPFKRYHYQETDLTTGSATQYYDCVFPEHLDGEAILSVVMIVVGVAAVLLLERLGGTAGDDLR